LAQVTHYLTAVKILKKSIEWKIFARTSLRKSFYLKPLFIYLLFFGLSIGDEIKYNVVPRASTDETGLVTDEEVFLIN